MSEAVSIVEPRAPDGYLPARRVWERYGVTSMTLHRWLNNQQMGFPRPVYFGRFRFWRIADLERFERALCTRRSPSGPEAA